MLNKFAEKGYVPTLRTYNCIISGFVKEGAVSTALSVYKKMSEDGIPPNVVTYTSLINGFCKRNDIGLALKMHDEMINNGFELDITAYVFSFEQLTVAPSRKRMIK
ncbi:hypothetical protein K1719_007187 [Acacia pycnantha]|nr:hypothetical protein K1719_007187 [Acacia pycnantha]